MTGITPSTIAPAPVVRHCIVGTAGHIDHGKTSLVHRLTGVNTDRLPEEQRRGMTIELGFADMTVGDVHFGIVDVPGHEKFVRTMVSGATGVDIALLVVAADDSVMQQTIEHIDILRLLGIRHGVVALTKIDVVDAELAEMVREEVAEALCDTPLQGAVICPVSSVTGEGVAGVRSALVEASRRLDEEQEGAAFRMAVDRVFTVQGRGSVVTGSVLGGEIAVGDFVEVMPYGVTAKVRGIQSHGRSQDRIGRGQRAALNLSGVEREQLERGCELAAVGYLQPTRILDVTLQCLANNSRSLPTLSTVRLGMGTREVPARIALLGRSELPPGETCFAQVRSGAPLVASWGQRFILRDAGAVRTIGGGMVLHPNAPRRKGNSSTDDLVDLSAARPEVRVERVLRSSGFQKMTDLGLSRCAGIRPSELPLIRRTLEQCGKFIDPGDVGSKVLAAVIDDVRNRLVSLMERHHRAHPETPGKNVDSVHGWLERIAGKSMAGALLARFTAERAIRRIGKFACLPAFAPKLSGADEKLLAALLAEFRTSGFQPPDMRESTAGRGVEKKRLDRLVELATALGDLIRIDSDIFLHMENEQRLRTTVAALAQRPEGVTVADAREALGSSRKYLVPYLEYLDRVGVTSRDGDRRVLGAAGCSKSKESS